MTSWGLAAQEQHRALVISSAPAAAVAQTLPYTAVLALTQLALNVWEAHCSDMRGAHTQQGAGMLRKRSTVSPTSISLTHEPVRQSDRPLSPHCHMIEPE
jgi:hypothetical protein